MPSNSYQLWATMRADDLDEIAHAHAAVGGTKRGRRHATQQINRAYAVLLASHFQGFCRDLHTESVDYLVSYTAPPVALQLVTAAFIRGRRLNHGNAQPAAIKEDFDRLGIDLWAEIARVDPQGVARRTQLELLNTWRNAIAHHSFDPARLGGTTNLRLAQVRAWRTMCDQLAAKFDNVVGVYLGNLTGRPPW